MVIRPRRRARRGLYLVAILVLLFLATFLARFYTDVLWFREVSLTSVLFKSLSTQFIVGVVVGALVGIVVWVNLYLAARFAPAYPFSRFEVAGRVDPMDQYRDAMLPRIGLIRLAASIAIGFLSGLSAASAWQTYLLWANRVSFGQVDPQFHKDIGFFVFELPFFRAVAGWVWLAVIVSLLAAMAAHYFHGAIRPQARLAGVMPAALAHISVLLGLLALVKAVQYWLGTYSLDFSPRGVVTGASYTDVHAQLPALKLLAIISIVSAILFLVNIRFRTVALPLAAVGIWILFAFVVGGLWPLVVQNFSVKPQELQRETPYIARNIVATRKAFGVDAVKTSQFPASNNLTGADLQAPKNQTLLGNVRVWDPGVLQRALAQLQALRTYYSFNDVDVDRYLINGQMRQVLLSARELSPQDLEGKSKTWANLHLVFTHGYGLVATLANGATAQGQPQFLVSDVPGTVAPGAQALNPAQRRVYYGESFTPTEYAIVNSKQKEIDYPTQNGVARFSYAGTGGIPTGSFFRRAAFAIREGDPNLVLSNLLDSNSRIMIYRNVRDRVERAAPFLSLDNDPYIASVGGHLVWILDAYTTTPYYPYSQREDMTGVVDQGQAGALHGRINYIRNSVKVVVDAYSGAMKFYVVDKTDPLIQAWEKAFPSLFTAGEAPADLRAHFRYPEDLFKVQSEVYRIYHMTQPAVFYQKEDAWAIPRNPLAKSQLALDPLQEPSNLPPTYLLIRLPGESQDQFLLTRPFTPRGRDNMISFFTANSGPAQYGELQTLQFPRQRPILSPFQINNLINQDVSISRALSLLSTGGSTVIFGSQVVLPVNDSILYVQPLFVSASNVGNPELKRVIVAYNGDTVMRGTLPQALTALFGKQAGAPQPPGKPGGGGGGGGQGASQNLIKRADSLYRRAQAALQKGDFATYGQLTKELGRVLQRALSQASGSTKASPKPHPSPSKS
ncbi:MAG: uncharacterized protein QOG21_736 [Actinomycetota bacterium]|jgi:uncharacterized membrane protein (UPF0182 family)|nr:uncharacterized protein [Actinomycetota bacterium]